MSDTPAPDVELDEDGNAPMPEPGSWLNGVEQNPPPQEETQP